ncbi:MAG TPA: S41 family peptidase, partial [Thermoanaerobaculia bacterium]|nr:S41 family peptidase [Thermoanaerobaculia bacterium]
TAPVDPAPALREEQGVGVLRVVSLEPAALTQLEKLVEEANTRHYSRLVIDLRGVLTGDPEAAYKTAGLFVRGELGSLVRRGNKVETFTSSKEPRWQGRVVVLINHSTLGAAEVLAAVLKQKAAAQLVGQRSFGFAGHQTLAPLSAGGQLLYTDGFYTGPDGEPLRKGLTPDSRVEELPLEPVSEGTEPPSPSDTVLKKGLEVVLGDAGATASKASESKVAS